MLDTVATVIGFAVAALAIPVLPFLALSSVMIGDGGGSTTRTRAVLIAAIGIPATVLTILAAALVWAVSADGLTFYIPLIAIVGEVAAVGVVLTVALRVHRAGLPEGTGDPAHSRHERTQPRSDQAES